MNRSLITAIVCVVVVVLAAVWFFTRPPSGSAREKDEAGWRVCADCGHEWHMAVSEAVAQSKQNPEGTGWVKCSKCGAWRGMPGMLCPKCGRRFPIPLAERNEEYVYRCYWCGYAPPLSSLGDGGTLPGPENADKAEEELEEGVD